METLHDSVLECNPMADKVIAHFRRDGEECFQSFMSLDEAYDFLSRGAEAGNIEVATIDSHHGEVILSRAAFDEMRHLNCPQREGWFAVLSSALAERSPLPE